MTVKPPLQRTTVASRRVAWMALALVAAWLPSCRTPSAPPPRPNIILIMADDLGIETIGAHGGESYQTPHLDRLAAGGMRFDHAHSQPLCTPTRVKIMTGLSNARNYSSFSILDPDQVTLGHHFRDAGYRTHIAGKWQLYGAEHYKENAGIGMHPRDSGFQTWCLWQVERLGSRYHDPRIDRNGVLEDRPGEYGPDLFCQSILDFIDAEPGQPFFAYYPMVLPHDPFVPSPFSTDPDRKDRQFHFADMVSHMDRIVGRIVAHLESRGLRDRTLVLFTADNGTPRPIHSYRHGRDIKGGKKLTIDDGTHVPLIVSWPGVVPAGEVCDDLIDFVDFLPTLDDAAGLTIAEPLDGVSFWPQLRGQRGTPRPWITCYYNARPGQKGWNEIRFARDHQYKLYDDGRLFDVVADPLEESPLPSDGHDAPRRKLQDALATIPEPTRIRWANAE